MALEIHKSIDALAPEWEELADHAEAMPWLRPGWVAAWWSAFGRGRLHIPALRHRGRLTALALLQSRAGGLVSLSNWHTPEFGLLASDEEAGQELARLLIRGSRGRFTLSFLDEEGESFHSLQTAAVRAGFRVLVRVLECSPYVQTAGTWETYADGLQRKLVREVARSRRRLSEKGEVRLCIEDGTERLGALLEEGFEVEAAGWKGTEGTAMSSHPNTRGFYREVAKWAAGRGSLRLAFLRLDHRPVAFDLCLEESGVHYALKSGFDPTFAKFGPGILMRYSMLDRAFSGDISRYEFLGGADEWKMRWTLACHKRLQLQAFAPSVRDVLAWTAYAYGRPLAQRLLVRVGIQKRPLDRKPERIDNHDVTTQ